MNKEEIQAILSKGYSDNKYLGFDMSATHSQDNNPIRQHNIDLCKKFGIYVGITNYLSCWKGTIAIHINKLKEPFGRPDILEDTIQEFSGWESARILEWLLINQKRLIEKVTEEKIGISRVIKRQQRFEVIKRQKWKCNICHETLKYDGNSDWSGKIAHIDHVHPFSKRETYPNGIENVNESSNLQALCPDCNLKKGKREDIN